MTRESEVEKYLKQRVEQEGGEIRKVQWVGRKGAPDRFVALKGTHLVELKKPGKGLEDHQQREHERLKKHGVKIYVIDSFTGVDVFMQLILND